MGLGPERELASWSCGPCGARWVLNVCLPGALWCRAVLLFLSFRWGCILPVSGVVSFSCWRTCAGEGVGSGGVGIGAFVLGTPRLVPALAPSPAGNVLARCGSPASILRAEGSSFLFGPGPPILIVPFPLEVDLGPADGTEVPLSWGSSLMA